MTTLKICTSISEKIQKIFGDNIPPEHHVIHRYMNDSSDLWKRIFPCILREQYQIHHYSLNFIYYRLIFFYDGSTLEAKEALKLSRDKAHNYGLPSGTVLKIDHDILLRYERILDIIEVSSRSEDAVFDIDFKKIIKNV